MSKQLRLLLGILSILPLLSLGGYFLTFISMFFSAFRQSGRHAGPPDFVNNNLGLMMLLLSILIITGLGLLIYYIVHVLNNRKLNSMEQLTWILMFLLGGVVSFPIYWYMKIWKEDEGVTHTHVPGYY